MHFCTLWFTFEHVSGRAVLIQENGGDSTMDTDMKKRVVSTKKKLGVCGLKSRDTLKCREKERDRDKPTCTMVSNFVTVKKITVFSPAPEEVIENGRTRLCNP